MKQVLINVKTIKQAKSAISRYEMKNPMIWQPCNGSYGRWTLSWISNKENTRIGINMILFPKIIKLLIEKYGKAIEEVLIPAAISSKEKGLVQTLWKYTDNGNKKRLMAEFLGGKE